MTSTRIIIGARVTDIPGNPQARHRTLASQFCKQKLNRVFDDELRLSSRDHIHIPGEFDSEKALMRWFVLDLNITGRLRQEEVLRLPHEVYVASIRGSKW